MPNREQGVYVQGLEGMQRVLTRAEHALAPELRKRLRDVGGDVAVVARANAPARSGRLRGSVKVSATLRGASVYSTSAYGGVQDYGGRVGRDHATLLERGSVSQYMTRAAQSEKGRTSARVEGILDWLGAELGS